MKRPRREAGGGEVALMAVITKAMGAFLVLVVIMLPDYVYVVNSGADTQSAQQAIGAAATQTAGIAEALKSGALGAGQAQALAATAEAASASLKGLNDEVASLSSQVGRAQAEIERLRRSNAVLAGASIDNKNPSDAVQDAQRKVDAAIARAAAIADALKSGGLSAAQAQALAGDAAAAEAALKALREEVANLNGQLDRAQAAIAELRKSNDELEAEAADQKNQIGKLKDRKRPATLITLSWADCYGADIDLYVHTELLGGGSNNVSPAVDRTRQYTPAWTDEKIYEDVPAFAVKTGANEWSTPDNGGAQRFTLWAKLRNAVKTTHSISRNCAIDWQIVSSTLRHRSNTWTVSDDRPMSLLFVYDVNPDGEISEAPFNAMSDAEARRLIQSAYQGACEGLLCQYSAMDSPQADEAATRQKYIAYIKESLQADDISGDVFDLVASGALSVADSYRWLGLLPAAGAKPGAVASDADLQAVRDLLTQKGAPPIVAAAITERLKSGALQASVVNYFLARFPDRAPAPAVANRQASADGDPLKALLKEAVASGDLAVVDADRWLGGIRSAAPGARPDKSARDETAARLATIKLPPAVIGLLRQMILAGAYDLNAVEPPKPLAGTGPEP